MTGGQGKRRDRRSLVLFVLAIALGGPLAGLVLAANPNERAVKPEANPQDPGQINTKESPLWVLDFKFKDPRIIKVDVPGRGTKVCLYLWYQVINFSNEPRYFIPEFELVTNDKNTVHKDQVLPKVQRAIIRIEDPTADPNDPESGYLKIKNSVTISKEPIPVSKPGAAPKAVTGVAIWDDVNPDSNRYSIFVAGLSNGWALTDDPESPDKQIVRRKTLQLDFKRIGDRFEQKSEEIKFVGPAKWIYRASTVQVPPLPGKKLEKPQDKPAPKP